MLLFSLKEKKIADQRNNTSKKTNDKKKSGGYTGGKIRLIKEQNKNKMHQKAADRKQQKGMF